MTNINEVKKELHQICEYIRVVRRCLGGVRDTPEISEKTIHLLCDILDVVYTLREQLSEGDEKILRDASQLGKLHELCSLMQATLELMEKYLHPGGVGLREFRSYLLERSLMPRLQQYKVLFILAAQLGSQVSPERLTTEAEGLHQLRQLHQMEPTIDRSLDHVHEMFKRSDRFSTENFIVLANLFNRLQNGSCQWVLQHQKYRHWLRGSCRALYCVGAAGIGKTFLSSFVIGSLQRTYPLPGTAVIFLFCHRETGNERGCPALLQKILSQLLYHRRAMSQSTESLYCFEASSNTKASSKAYQNAIRAEVNHFSKVFLVVDGLDAISDKDRFLSRMQKLPDHVQLFVTLRDCHETMKDSLTIQIETPERDLRGYITTRLCTDSKLAHLKPVDEHDNNLHNDIVRYVAQRSHGIFLLARLHLDLLASYEEKTLVHSALTHLPETLNEVYAEIMKRILTKRLNSRRMIYWALFSRKPLTVAELRYATTESSHSNEIDCDLRSFGMQLINETCGLLTIDSVTGAVLLVHQTAKDALERMAAASIVFASAHKEIAEKCLTLLSKDEIVDACYSRGAENSSHPCHDTLLLDYAASYWGYHARFAAEDEQTIQVLTTTFLNKISWRRPATEKMPVYPYAFPDDLAIGQYPSDWTSLHYLAYFDITSRSKRLIEQNVNVNCNDNFLSLTPLHCAAYRGHEAMVNLLLENGAKIDAQSNTGDTALHFATIKGHRKVMKLLLANGASLSRTNENGNMILHTAVGTMDDEATIPLLIKSGADVNAINTVTGDTGLHLAVKTNRPRILLYLLNKKANMECLNKMGLTPLHLAVKLNNCEVLPLLLERGAGVESRSQNGLTALHAAAQANHWVAFDLLLAAGADINVWDVSGDTLLHTRAVERNNSAVISKLLDRGANLEARNAKGYTPLQAAALAGNKEMFDLLLQWKANIAVETPRGESLLHITPPSNQEFLDVHHSLLEKGLSVDALSSEGWKPIHQAAFKGTGFPDTTLDKSCEHLELLLSHGADINCVTKDSKQETPLHLAVRAAIPRPSYISLLLSHGADVNKKNGEGRTALHLAAARGRETLFRILLDYGADASIKAPEALENILSEPERIVEKKPLLQNEAGLTAFELAKRNPLGALWFDDNGGLRPATPQSRRTSAATLIESDIEDDHDSETATGATTVTGGSSVVADE